MKFFSDLLSFLFGPKPPFLSPEEFLEKQASGAKLTLIDVREPYEVRYSPIAEAQNIPLRMLAKRSADVPKTGEVVFLCPRGHRAAKGASLLIRKGATNVSYVKGGLKALEACRMKKGE